MQQKYKQSSDSSQPRFLITRQSPSFTIQTDFVNRIQGKSQTLNGLYNFKSQDHIVITKHISLRKPSLKQSIKLPALNNFICDTQENITDQYKRTSFIENIKKVDFHPSVLVIYSENGVKKREKLTEEPMIKRTSKRKNCILIQKQRRDSEQI